MVKSVLRGDDETSPSTTSPALRLKSRGIVLVELMFALGIVTLAIVPLAFAFHAEQRMFRACYHRAVVMELVDGEMEILAAGEWRAYRQGKQPFTARGDAAKNLPPGQFLLTIAGSHAKLEWLPEKPGAGGHFLREAKLR